MTFRVESNVSLQSHNTMAVVAQAAYLAEAHSVEDIRQAIDFSDQKNLPLLILGEGSNTIFSKDYDGLVLLNRLKGIQVLTESDKTVTVKVAAGEIWHDFVAHTIEQAWIGLENLALIPGLVGAAPIQNIGAYGVELTDSLLTVDAIDINSKEPQQFSNEQCEFAYRDSVFKHAYRNKYVITAVTFKLSKTASTNISYGDIANYFGDHNPKNAKQVFAAVCAIRSAKLPSPDSVPNAGSFFKNPIVSTQKHTQLMQSYSDMVSYSTGPQYKLAAAWLIEKAGWKHKARHNISVHQQQALVLINPKRERGKYVLAYAKAIQSDVFDKFGVELIIEPQIY